MKVICDRWSLCTSTQCLHRKPHEHGTDGCDCRFADMCHDSGFEVRCSSAQEGDRPPSFITNPNFLFRAKGHKCEDG